jgi:hypothetical protein
MLDYVDVALATIKMDLATFLAPFVAWISPHN